MNLFDPEKWLGIREAVHEQATADFEKYSREFDEARVRFIEDSRAGLHPSGSETTRLERRARHAHDLAKASRGTKPWIWYRRTPHSKVTNYARKVIDDAQD